jgi:hypothetical protein
MTKPLNGGMQRDYSRWKSPPRHHTRCANGLTSYLGFAFLKVSLVSHRYLTKSDNTHALPELITHYTPFPHNSRGLMKCHGPSGCVC